MRSAGSIVLGGELFVVLFAALVARGLSDASDRAVLIVSLVMVVLIFAAMAGRFSISSSSSCLSRL